MKNKTMLEVKKLIKRYDKFLLDEVSLSVESGKILGLIGPNGSGKSTTMKLVLGIVKPDGGKIFFDGKECLSANCKFYKEQIGYVGENIDFFEKCRLKDIKNFYKSFYPTWDEEHFSMLLKQLQLDENYKMVEMSKGMKVKFMLNLALSHKPRLLLMDEPTSGLDPLVRNEILGILKEYVKKNEASIIFSSHITEDMEKIADELIFIYKGKIIERCFTHELVNKGIAIDSYLEEMIDGGKDEKITK